MCDYSEKLCVNVSCAAFKQSFPRLQRSLKRDWLLSLSFSNPWTPLPPFSMWPSSREGVSLSLTWFLLMLPPQQPPLFLSFLLSGLLGAQAITFMSLVIIAWRRFVWLFILVVVCTSLYSKCGSAFCKYLLFSPTVCSTRLPHWALHPAQHDHVGKAAHSEQCVWGSHSVRIRLFNDYASILPASSIFREKCNFIPSFLIPNHFVES